MLYNPYVHVRTSNPTTHAPPKTSTTQQPTKNNTSLDFAFLAVVDLAQARSDLLICGAAELHLSKAAFQGAVSR